MARSKKERRPSRPARPNRRGARPAAAEADRARATPTSSPAAPRCRPQRMPARCLNSLMTGITLASRGTTDSEGERVQADWKLLAEQLLQERSPSEQSAKAALEWLAEREGKTL